jgi:hypothetical protein
VIDRIVIEGVVGRVLPVAGHGAGAEGLGDLGATVVGISS